jgi:two-component system response regulator RstA
MFSLHDTVPAAAPGVGPAPVRRVLIAGDDDSLLAPLRDSLAAEGLEARLLLAPDDAAVAGNAHALLLIVARGLAPQLGRLREWRRWAPTLPLLVICRGLRELDQVLALETGADDVVDAAWSAAVVAARLRALWRRPRAGVAPTSTADELRFGSLRLLLGERRVLQAERVVPLTEGEFEVLWLLASHAGQALSRRDILKRVRGLDEEPMDRSIDSRVYRIRAKLGDAQPERHRIRTVRNRGYLFSPGDA